MSDYRLPYGKAHLTLTLPDDRLAQVIAPAEAPPAPDPLQVANDALDNPVGRVKLADFAGARSAAIAINDKTRPVPHQHLLPPLLRRLEALGIAPERLTLIIATGTHPPMLPEEFPHVVPPEVLARCRVICHDCDDEANLLHLGETERGTPIWMNRHYMEADLRLVAGNIEPHQFMGFSGGVKSAAIGLAGKATINHNHALMTDPNARLGQFEGNPARADVEEIGRRVGIHFALNAILNRDKKIVMALAGAPIAVMTAGIPLVTRLYTVPVSQPFDLVIASPGGHPKDINLYQAQKALAHASLVTRQGGTIILVAACPEGTGSQKYEDWMLGDGMTSYRAIFERFAREGFRIGPHKAYQIARDAARARVFLVSEMPPEFTRKLLLTPATLEEAMTLGLSELAAYAQIGILPNASAIVPCLVSEA